MLEAGVDAVQEKTCEGLPLVKLDDNAGALGRFLQYALDPSTASDPLDLQAAGE
jgi:hypothetical protein